MRNQSSASRNTLFEVGLLLVICALFVWFVILPKRADLDQKQSAYDAVSVQEQGVSAKVAGLNAMIQKLQSSSGQTAQLDQALPLDGDIIKPRLLVQKLADDSGVTVGSIDVAGVSGSVAAGDTNLLKDPFGQTRTPKTLGVSVYVLGSFNQLMAFLRAIEQSGRLMNVSAVAVAQDSQGALNMKLTMGMYYLAP